MIDCPFRVHEDAEYSECRAAKNEVHEGLCRACLEASGGNSPDPMNPNRWLASAILSGFMEGRHKDRGAADLARVEIAAAQFEDIGVKVDRKALLARLSVVTPEEGPQACYHLGRVVERQGCLCWRKHSYQCNAKEGVVVTPERDCPCEIYELP
jgi:hypothetical protein